jgi:disulfide bond formation protein DsbB
MKPVPWTMLFLAWLIAACSMLGALFLGEVMGFVPCPLCWYQRICMFPLVAVLGVGLLSDDPKAVRYGLPLGVIGFGIAVFHTLLQAGIIPETMTPCSIGVSCAKLDVVWFGFITIPLLSAMAFLTINLLLIATYFKVRK